MKKHLLLGLLAGMTALSASALGDKEFVYTNQGRFQISNAQNLYTGNFTDFSGWTAISATEGTAVSSLFTTDTDETVGTFIKSQVNTSTEGMYYQYTPVDASASFVVSFKAKGTAVSAGVPPLTTVLATNTYEAAPYATVACMGDAANVIKVVGVAEDGTETDLNSPVQIPGEWDTVAFGVDPDGASYSYYKIYFQAMNTSLEIADLQIQSAVKVANLKQRDALLKYADAFATANPDVVTSDYTENYDLVKGISDLSTQAELEDAMTGLNTILTENVKPTFDDQLTSTQSKFGTWSKLQKQSTWGQWTCYPSGRGFCSADQYPDLGHYTGYAYWSYTKGGYCGISMDATLEKGNYVFVTNALGQSRMKKSSKCWDVNTGLEYVYGKMFVINAAGDTIATTGNYGISPRDYTQGVLSFSVAEAGTYSIWMQSYAYDDYVEAMLGGALILKDVELYGKTNAEYSKLQETYYSNVQTQVTAGRTGLDTAKGYIASADYKWGKADLQAMIDSCEAKVKAYEDSLEDKAAVIATMPEDYAGGTSTISKGSEEVDAMAYRAYVNATKYVLDANTKFLAKNDTLASLAAAIASAKTTFGKRIYETSTTKADFEAEIAQAEALNAEMLAADYSEENAAKIVAENAALVEAANTFASSVPAENIKDIIDIDFSNAATIADADVETANTTDNTGVAATIAGKLGEMTFTNFSVSSPSTITVCPYELGIAASNGEKDSLGILRCGNGVATVAVSGAPVKSTDIVTVSFDYYYGLFTGKNSGYYVLSEEGDTICGLVCSKYDGTEVFNTFAVDFNNNITGVGSSSASNAAIAASSNATRFTIVLDYGKGTMYCTTSGSKGAFTSNEVAFDINKKIGSFVLYSNYTNHDRRCWFDNLKIQNVAAGVDAGISNVTSSSVADGAIYNIAGQKVGKNYKGIVVKNGQKFINK